jgi:FtsZ-interacting cell division protein ZipA
MGRLIIFGIVIIAVALLIWAMLPERQERKRISGTMPKHRREALTVDELLEKISTSGVESLTPEEKELLDSVSGKYQRRADSKKPDSDLIL